jgi:hypothetical protein
VATPARLASSAIFMTARYTFDRLEGQDPIEEY